MPAAWWHPRPKKEWEGMPAAWWHPGRSIKPGERIVLLVCPMLSSIPRRLCLCASAARSALYVSVASSVLCRPGHRGRAVIAAAQVASGSPGRRHCRRLPWRPCAGSLQMVSRKYYVRSWYILLSFCGPIFLRGIFAFACAFGPSAFWRLWWCS